MSIAEKYAYWSARINIKDGICQVVWRYPSVYRNKAEMPLECVDLYIQLLASYKPVEIITQRACVHHSWVKLRYKLGDSDLRRIGMFSPGPDLPSNLPVRAGA
jgi:hypothetical protein